MTHPRVSICIPAYSRPDTLAHAIGSVLSQGVEDVEVLVTDDSGALERVVNAAGDSRVRYVGNSRRLGLAGNWTNALRLARANVVGLLMDDDRLLPGFLHKTLAVMDADSSVDVAFTDHFFDRGGRLYRRACALPTGRYDRFLEPLLRYMPVAVSAALMRRTAYEACLPLPDLLTADVALHVCLAQRGAVFAYVNEPLMAYRVHPGQLSQSEERFRNDRVAVWSLFKFDDPVAERYRRQRLAGALVDRAATHLKGRRFDAARADLNAASQADPSVGGVRGATLRGIARFPWAVPPATAALRLARHFRRT